MESCSDEDKAALLANASARSLFFTEFTANIREAEAAARARELRDTPAAGGSGRSRTPVRTY